jgi:uncharacterized membrane protein YfcA
VTEPTRAAAAPADTAPPTAAPGHPVRPNGPVAAVLLATGIGSLVLAVLVVWAEASESFAESLAYSDRVGPLAGKTTWAVVAFLVSWAGLHAYLRRRDVNLQTVWLITLALLALGLLGTFSPFFELFAPAE